MALSATSLFASFDLTAQTNELDISPVLAKALYYDLNLAGALPADLANPVTDTTFYWNEDAINSDTVTVSGSVTSTATTINVSSTHGLRVHVGDYLYQTGINQTEVAQVTAISTDALTVVRGINSTTQASIADAATLGVIRVEQDASDIGSDRSLNATVRSNTTQILSAFDIQISGSQLARKMATTEMQDFFAHQLANRALEMKINLTRAMLYSEKSASAGSDTVYRSMGGIRNWIRDNSGITNSSSEALSYSVLNTHNTTSVNKGGTPPNLLVCGTDLVASLSGIDSSVRRLRESDTQVGYTVQEILLNQGNMVQVVVDSRVNTGGCFLLVKEHVIPKPMAGRGMFVIAAKDFVDGRKARVLGEWTLQYINPQTGVHLSNKT
jgi:hypothetical protein